jgi:hypothetical protein
MALRTYNLPPEFLKCDFGDIDEAMFHDVERSFESIFYILGHPKIDFGEEACYFFSSRMALRTNYLPSGHIKKRLC